MLVRLDEVDSIDGISDKKAGASFSHINIHFSCSKKAHGKYASANLERFRELRRKFPDQWDLLNEYNKLLEAGATWLPDSFRFYLRIYDKNPNLSKNYFSAPARKNLGAAIDDKIEFEDKWGSSDKSDASYDAIKMQIYDRTENVSTEEEGPPRKRSRLDCSKISESRQIDGNEGEFILISSDQELDSPVVESFIVPSDTRYKSSDFQKHRIVKQQKKFFNYFEKSSRKAQVNHGDALDIGNDINNKTLLYSDAREDIRFHFNQSYSQGRIFDIGRFAKFVETPICRYNK
jgi:hypothetical protein